MENLLLYFVKANGLIILFYLMYVLFLRKETFFTSNRWYLIGGLVLSLILPLITFTKTIWVEPTPIPVIYEELIPINNNAIGVPDQETALDWPLILTTAYAVISILLLMKITFELASFFKRIRKNQKQKETNFVLIHSDTTENPFSFFHYIVINPNRFSKEEFQHILTHESIHVKQKHSIDVLLAKLFCALFWANPIVWLYRKAMLQNLEFIADSETFQQIENKYEYQKTLLKVVTHQHDLSITNQFYQSLIKKRIVMLHTNQSHKRNAWKYGIILPLLVGFMLLFQIETVAQVKKVVTNEITKSEEKVSVIITPKMSNENLKQIEKIFSDSDLTLKISNLKRDKNDALTAIKIVFKTKSGEIKEYKIDRSIPIETVELYKSNNRDNEDYFGFKKLSETLTYKFTEADTEEIAIVGKAQDSNDKNSWTVDDMVKNGKKVKMIINGKLQSENEKIKIPLDQELDVLKELDEKELKSKYNIDKKEGEIYYELLTKKEKDKSPGNGWGISYQTETSRPENLIEEIKEDEKIDYKKSLIIFDGKEISSAELDRIDPKNISSMSSISGSKYTIKKYGEKASNGVIEIESIEYNKKNNPIKINVEKDVDFRLNDDNDGFVINKTSQNEDLEFYKSILIKNNIAFEFNSIERNEKNQITSITIQLSENGKIEKKIIKSNNVIPKIFIGKRKGTLIITETK